MRSARPRESGDLARTNYPDHCELNLFSRLTTPPRWSFIARSLGGDHKIALDPSGSRQAELKAGSHRRCHDDPDGPTPKVRLIHHAELLSLIPPGTEVCATAAYAAGHSPLVAAFVVALPAAVRPARA